MLPRKSSPTRLAARKKRQDQKKTESQFDRNFPSFRALPHYDDPCGPYYAIHDGITLLPTCNWVFLAEIVSTEKFLRVVLDVRTRHKENVRIAFYPDANDQPTTFSYQEFQVGRTIAITSPFGKQFMDGSFGVRVEDLDDVFCFPASLDQVMKEGKHWLETCKQPKQCNIPECTEMSALKTCAGCKMVAYCGKEHQTQDWKTAHRLFCRDKFKLQTLRDMFVMAKEPTVKFACHSFSNIIARGKSQ
jgi:hypothetical protein